MAPAQPRRYLALRTGLATASGITGATFARGLLPRSLSDQAMATGAVAAIGLGTGTFAVSAIEATTARGLRHRKMNFASGKIRNRSSAMKW